MERLLQCSGYCDDATGKDMKIYLLVLLMGTLLTAVHFTSASERGSKPLP